MLANCDIVVIFPVYSQFGTMWKPDSNVWFVELTFSLRVTFYLIKTENRTEKSLHSSHAITLSKGTIFAKK